MIKALRKLNMGVLLGIALLLILVTAALLVRGGQPAPTSYADCAKRKDAKILEIYPEQCVVDGKTYVNDVSDAPGVDEFSDDLCEGLCSDEN